MAFVVDSSEWSFDGWSEDEVRHAIEHLIGRVWAAHDRDEAVWIGEDLQSRRVLGDSDIWSLLAPGAPVRLPAELGQELAAWLGPARCYLDEEPWPAGMDNTQIQVDDNCSVNNVDQAWAHHHVRSGKPVACLSLRRAGPHTTISALGSVIVHWVVDESTQRAFWRSAIELAGGSAEVLERLSPHAYPDLYFCPEVWRGLNDFAGGYLAVRNVLTKYLTELDRMGAWAFTFPPPTLVFGEAPACDSGPLPSNQIVERRFHGLNLDLSPENPNVRKDNKCRRAREITLESRILYCEWHGKLERHRNRIYIHPPVSESNGKVVIGIFTEHLPLPT